MLLPHPRPLRSGSAGENFLHLPSQLLQPEGFGQEVQVLGFFVVAAEGLFGITRHEDDGHFRPAAAHRSDRIVLCLHGQLHEPSAGVRGWCDVARSAAAAVTAEADEINEASG